MLIAATSTPIEPPADTTTTNANAKETPPPDVEGMPAAGRDYNEERWAADERQLAYASRTVVKFLMKETTLGACGCAECIIARRILSVPKRIKDRGCSSIDPIGDEIVMLLADVAAELDRERKKRWGEVERLRRGRRDDDDEIPF